ncbi:unknown protein [Grouper iridovirus]|uniref:Hemagglutinin n=1 Tax=Grouper iridovirus TaxID=127569 RepID=Q5GAK3_9VIRU|nr:unknown protein [Grouper iridovirus]
MKMVSSPEKFLKLVTYIERDRERIMANFAVAILLGLIGFVAPVSAVDCYIGFPCKLDCRYSGEHLMIIWTDSKNKVVLTYQDQPLLRLQDQAYKDKVQMAGDSTKITNGDASLMIKSVTWANAGTYKCHVNRKDVSSSRITQFVTVEIKNPIDTVSIFKLNNTLLCHSSDIRGVPLVYWNTSIAHNISQTSVEGGMYTVSSHINVKDITNYYLTCNVSTEHGWKSSTYGSSVVRARVGQPAVIPCMKENYNHSSVMWLFDGQDEIKETAPSWNVVSINATSLRVTKLNNLGRYTCIVISAHRVFNITVYVVEDPLNYGVIIAVVIVVIILLLFCTPLIYMCCKIAKNVKKSQLKHLQKHEKKENYVKCEIIEILD